MSDKDVLHQQLLDDEYHLLASIGESITVPPKETIIHHGTTPTYLYVVDSGKVDIIKPETNSQKQHKIVQLGKDAILGALEFTDSNLSSTSAVTATTTSLTRYPVSQLKQLANGVHDTLYNKITANLSRVLVQRIRYVNDVVVLSLQQELATAEKSTIIIRFSVLVGFLMVLYVLGLPYVTSLSKEMVSSTYATSTVLIVFTSFLVYYIYSNRLSWNLFGIKKKNVMLQFWQGIYYSLPCLVIIFLLKLFIITQISEYQSEPLFNFFGSLNSPIQATATWHTLVPIISMYILFSIAQEFSTRCVLQGSYQYFLSGTPYGDLKSIVMANMVFSACHLHISPKMVLLVCLPGFFWGWLFHRTRSLISIAVSHTLIGCWALFILGFGFLFLE